MPAATARIVVSLVALAAAAVVTTPLGAHDSRIVTDAFHVDRAPRADASSPADSAAVHGAVERFRAALSRGDSATALSLLTPDATILESGGSETVAEYRAHHLPADIEFARAVRERRAPTRVTVRGDVAWAMGTSTARGTFRGRAVNSASAELMVLARTADGWRIAAIHWSSRRRKG